MARHRVGIVIPAKNEAETISAVVSKAALHGQPIVVDDDSTDDTARIAADAGATVVSLASNQGYDKALTSGFAKAASLDCEMIVTLDADGQHDPSIIADFLNHLESDADLVVGVRDRRPRFAEYLFAWYTRLRFGISDPLCGMKGYRIEVYKALGHFDSYTSIGTELALFAATNGFRLREVPIRVSERSGAPRFGGALRANFKILRSLLYSLWRIR